MTSPTYHVATRLPVSHEAISAISAGANTQMFKLTAPSGTPVCRYLVVNMGLKLSR